MKLIDLINKRENGEEIPLSIIYNGEKYYYNGINYFTQFVGGQRMTFDFSDLDRNVEVIEEDKEIEQIKIEQDSPTYFYIKNEHGTKCGLTTHSRLIAEKLNEVIIAVNGLKKESK